MTEEDYPNDLAMHDAFKAEHKKMKNPHVRYTHPDCYYQMLTPFIPIDVGSTTRFLKEGEKQIIFIEDTFRPELVDFYEQETGIDIDFYVGMKIVSLNGEDPLEYFRQWGRTRLSWDDSDSTNLMGVLNRQGYFYRSSTTHDFIPDRPADVMVLESRNGKRFHQTFHGSSSREKS